MNLEIAGRPITLLPEKAILLEDGTLVVADLHLGKATAFQARGLAIPEGDSAADLQRLAHLAAACGATRILVNGDLFHSPAGLTPAIENLLTNWLEDLPIPVQLVLGNHDSKLPRIPHGLHPTGMVECCGIRIVHDPAEASHEIPSITAHWHPFARITDGKRTALRLPCFLLRHGLNLVLPAFGTFTGGQILAVEEDDRYFVAPAGKIIEVPLDLIR
ncbi:MAG: metallophosphoesterase [Akkermansiaceae bacterium]|nr:metallophosphoesterase [Akkermansiaceae bacterium]